MPCSIKLTERITIQIPGNTPKEIIQAGSFWLNDYPKACGNPSCKSGDIVPKHRLSKGFHFYEVSCRACHHSIKISEAKETNEFFIRWDAKWESPQQRRDSEAPAAGKLEDEPDAAW